MAVRIIGNQDVPASPRASYRLRRTLRRKESMWTRIAFSAATTSRWPIAWKILWC